ncbi:MAG: hypothetical protein BECKG1743D_GA0114223_101412 [Candidatus Kentron sp. G]|nr:MAG: hypothetical protein BECKG1743F_GA0114225_101215 [Candidatus Kentron sp. G]VFM96946.1 MAG: hypothetical protein BECKG1743E_GA0114224_101006 [Candidatus Kentron sp. G]VFM99720.1 MAG: hypothetical protein BECKG1743D_GA0114223_101412 [Candidatus Kentron sp. G]
MTAIAFNTLQFTRRLTQAGASRQLAEATAEAFKDACGEAELATKRDIERLEAKIEAKIDRLESRMDVGLAETKNEMIKWGVGLAVAQIALLLGILIKLT